MYIQELAALFPPLSGYEEVKTDQASTTEKTATTTQATSTISTNKASTTPKTSPVKKATTTQAAPQEEVYVPEKQTGPYKDVTLSNQNMRIWQSGNQKVIYAYVLV